MPETRGIVLFARTQTDLGVALFVDHDLPDFPKTPQPQLLNNNAVQAAAAVAARQFAFQQLQQQQAAAQQQSQNAGAGLGGASNPSAAQNTFLMAQMRAQQANQAQAQQQAKQLQQVQLHQQLQARLQQQQQQQLGLGPQANTNALGFMTGLPNAGTNGAFNPAAAQAQARPGVPPGFGSQEMSAQYQALQQQQQQRAFPNQQQQGGMPNFMNMGAGTGGANNQATMELFQSLLGQKPS